MPEIFGTINASMLHNINRTLVKECFEGGKEFSKQRVAELTQLSFPTASKIIDGMVRSGELVELGFDSSSGGRRAKVYKLNPRFSYNLVLQVRHKEVRSSVFDASGKRVESSKIEVRDGNYFAALKLCADGAKQNYKLVSMAIGVPGCVKDGTILSIEMYENLEKLNLKEIFEKDLHIPCLVENDVNAAVMGSYKQNASSILEDETFACIYVSENGPGCGLVVKGSIICGFAGFAGEVGNILFDGEQSFNKAVIADFAAVNKTDFLVRLALCVISLVNPKKLVFYRNNMVQSLPPDFYQKCASFVPDYAMPEICFSDSFEENYELGLYTLAREAYAKNA